MAESLGERLRVARAGADMTMRQAAAASGVSKESITKIERDLQRPGALTVARLARAYGRDPAEFLLEGAGKAEAPRAGPLAGWIERALGDGEFGRQFDRAKGSTEVAHTLHMETLEAFEDQRRLVKTLTEHDAPEGTLLEARRDYLMARARLTAAAHLWVEVAEGRSVASLDPRDIVASVIEAQRSDSLTLFDTAEPNSEAG